MNSSLMKQSLKNIIVLFILRLSTLYFSSLLDNRFIHLVNHSEKIHDFVATDGSIQSRISKR